MIPEGLGGILVGGGLFQLGLVTAANFRRLAGQNRQSDLSLELLKTEFEMTHDMRRLKAEGGLPWNGWRKFLVARNVMESADICSFYLAPHDKKTLPGFLPGQHLTFNLDSPGQPKPVVRCYSLSNGPRPEGQRRRHPRREGALGSIPPRSHRHQRHRPDRQRHRPDPGPRDVKHAHHARFAPRDLVFLRHPESLRTHHERAPRSHRARASECAPASLRE